jgi:predicted transcriptional regulator
MYFSDHTLGELPLKFVQRIGALDNSRLLESSVAVFEYLRELFGSSHNYVYAIMSEVPMHFIEYAWRALKREVKMNYLVSYNAVLPRKRHIESEHSIFQELLKMSQLQRRMAEQVQVNLVMNETRAIVVFPNLKGRTDFNFGFYNVDQVFHDWCYDCFDYRWQDSKPYDSKKLFEV